MHKREYPDLPMVGVGGIVISRARALLVRRATEPARGEWTIPGGLLEVGETLSEGVARELREETGLKVRVLELVEALERIFFDARSQFDAGSQESGGFAPAVKRDEAIDNDKWDKELHRYAPASQRGGTGPQPGGAGHRGVNWLDTSKESGRVEEKTTAAPSSTKPRYHYVILDYLCELTEGDPVMNYEITDFAFIREDEMERYALTPAATRVLHKAFAMARTHGL